MLDESNTDTEKVDDSITDNSSSENFVKSYDDIQISSKEVNNDLIDNKVAENVNEEAKNALVSVEIEKSSEIIVHAIVNFDGCLSRKLQDKDYKFVENIASRYDHLKQRRYI